MDIIKKIIKYFSHPMTLDEARKHLDVEEYAKMMKSLGLNNLK